MMGCQGASGCFEENWESDLVCPACGIGLRQTSKLLSCLECGTAWPIVDGVPYFTEWSSYRGYIPQEGLREINQQAAKGSWRSALRTCGDVAVQKASETMMNLELANWHWLITLRSDSKVLDVGAGMGTNAHALGKRCRKVIAVEPVLEYIEFMRHRFSQEGLDNVKVVRSSPWVLPFAEDGFDMVVMNGGVDWAPADEIGDPRDLQRKLLRSVFRLLRPAGYLYLGIENRYRVGYLRGQSDSQYGLPWVTLLPRLLADWYARRRGQPDGYRSYLYSSRGYRKLLKSAGFRNVDIYLALPSYNQPRFFIPLKNNVFNYYFRNFAAAGGGWKQWFGLEPLLRLGLLKYCEDSFVIVAQK